MANLGELSYSLSLDKSKFEKDVKDAKSLIEKLSSNLSAIKVTLDTSGLNTSSLDSKLKDFTAYVKSVDVQGSLDLNVVQSKLNGFTAEVNKLVLSPSAVTNSNLQSEISKLFNNLQVTVGVNVSASAGGKGGSKGGKDALEQIDLMLDRLKEKKKVLEAQGNILGNPATIQSHIAQLDKVIGKLETISVTQNKSDAQNFLDSSKIDSAGAAYEKILSLIISVNGEIAKLTDLQSKGGLGAEGTNALQSWQDLLTKLNTLNSGDVGFVTTLKSIRNEIATLKQQTRSGLVADAAARKDAENIQKVNTYIQQMQNKLQNLKAIQTKSNALGVDTKQIDRAVTLTTQLISLMRSANVNEVVSRWGKQYATIRAEIQGCAEEQRRLNSEAEKATRTSSANAQNIAKGMRQATTETNALKEAMRGLAPLIGDAFSVYGIQRFLQQIIQVGGEIQKQRLALGHILGNDSNANVLFGQMKDLAVKSPFGLLDLMQNARQLSAFGVEYNSLYDTMKRLSDVAAGLGIQFGRLSLAYGETMERGFLDGKLVRQFSYMGLPVLQKIAQYYTEINKAGNGQIFSASDVRKMVSNREVSFEDVNAVIQKMTDAGGQFANMQEVMAESVAGKWKNLKDAIDILYSDIAEGNSELLKAPAQLITSIVKNYEMFEGVLAVVAGRILGARAASLLYTTTLGRNLGSVQANMLAERKAAVASQMRTAAMKGATTAQLKELAMSKQITAQQLKEAVVKGDITAQEAKLIVMRQGLTKTNAQALLQMKLITKAQYDQLIAGKLQGLTLLGLSLKWKVFGMSVKIATAEMSAAIATMAANPMTWVFAALAAVTEIWSLISNINSQNSDTRNGMIDRLKETRQDAEEIAPRIKIKFDDNGNFIGTTAEIQTAIDELVTFIKNDVPGAQSILKEVFSVGDNGVYAHDITERYKILKEYYDKVLKLASDAKMQDVVDDVQDAMGSHWWNAIANDSLLQDAADYEKNYKNAKENILNTIRHGDKEIQDLTKVYRAKYGVTNDVELVEKLLDPENIAELQKFNGMLAKSSPFSSIRNRISIQNLKNDYEEYISELDDTQKELIKKLKSTFGEDFDFNHLGEHKTKVEYIVRAFLDNSEASDWVKQHMVDDIKSRWHIDISVGGDTDKVDTIWQQLYGDKISVGDNDNISDVIDNARKQLKEAKEGLASVADDKKMGKLNKLGKNKEGLFKLMGLDTTKADEQELYEFGRRINEMKKKYDDAKYVLDREGVGLTDPNKNKSKKDSVLQQFKDDFSALKDAYSEFEKWSKQVGKDRAGKVLENSGLFTKEEIANATSPQAYLNALKAQRDALQKVANTAERKKEVKDMNKVILDVELKIKQDEVQRFTSQVKDALSKAAKRNEIYKVWFEATGDASMATNMAKNFAPMWDESALALKNALYEEASKMNITLPADIDFNKDDKAVEEFLTSIDEKGIALADAFKQVRDAMISAGVAFNKATTDALKNTMTYAEKLAKLEKERQDALKDSNLSEEQRNRINRHYDNKAFDMKPEVAQFLSAVETMTYQQAQGIYDGIRAKLVTQLQSGEITIKEFNDSLSNADEQLRKSFNAPGNGFEALFKGGTTGLVSYIEKLRDNAIANGGDGSVAEYDALLDKINNAQKSLSSFDMYLTLATSALDGLQKAFTSLSQMFDALGNEHLSNVFGDIADGISGVSSIFAPASNLVQSALKGDVGGLISGAISAPVQMITAPITAFAKLNDKKQDRLIEQSKRNEKAITSASDNLKRAFERSLGGMYGKGNESYFNDQYDNLVNQRAEVQKQLQAEQDKKKTDKNAVQDYKDSLAELDDQIKNYAQDMADALYGINFKDWAKQIGDAVVDAWAKGEDAVKAYKDTVAEMMRGVVKSVVAQKFIGDYLEEAMTPFLKEFAASGGVMDSTLFGELEGVFTGLQGTVELIPKFLNQWEQVANKYDSTLKETESNTSLSGSISNINEQQADILVAYVNAMRSDLSIHKFNFESFMKDYIGLGNRSLNAIAEAQVSQLQNIASYTLRTAQAVEALQSRFDAVTEGDAKVNIR